jgi:hypothetical protein
MFGIGVALFGVPNGKLKSRKPGQDHRMGQASYTVSEEPFCLK